MPHLSSASLHHFEMVIKIVDDSTLFYPNVLTMPCKTEYGTNSKKHTVLRAFISLRLSFFFLENRRST
jgi:hypothetical protein